MSLPPGVSIKSLSVERRGVVDVQPSPTPGYGSTRSSQLFSDPIEIIENLDKVTIVSYDVQAEEEVEWQYFVKSSNRNLFVGLQDSFATETCCFIKSMRRIVFKADHSQEIAFSFTRRRGFYSLVSNCWLQKAVVATPMGSFIGTVEQEGCSGETVFRILDNRKNLLYYVCGPCRFSCPCSEISFRVVDRECKQVSTMTTDAMKGQNCLSIDFPSEATTTEKVLLTVCGILLVHMYLESQWCFCCTNSCCLQTNCCG